MSSKQLINQAIKESSFVKSLIPDKNISNVKNAIDIYLNDDKDIIKKEFNTPRLISSGSHYTFSFPEERKNYKLLLFSNFSLINLNLIDNLQLINICNSSKIYLDKSKFITPYSIGYSGFQFGEFAGQLGDGRVINLFDLKDINDNLVTLQLKGSGKTAFSRFADGKAIIKSCIREFICCENLHALGINSSRSLSITYLPGTRAQRGSKWEKCGIISRYATNWVRIGNFEMFRWRDDINGMKLLLDWCVERENLLIKEKNDYKKFYMNCIIKNAKTVAQWQSYGFVNGVLNTDNTSISGISLDFGPFSFIKNYDPNFDPNLSDPLKRYSYGNQPSAIWWNLDILGQSLGKDFLGSNFIDIIKEGKIKFQEILLNDYLNIMGKRLGIDMTNFNINEFQSSIYDPLINLLSKRKNLHYNDFFNRLSNWKKSTKTTKENLEYLFFDNKEIEILKLNENDLNIDQSLKYERRYLDEQLQEVKEWSNKYIELINTQKIITTQESNNNNKEEVNPIFLPIPSIFDNVYDELNSTDFNDTSSLEKLYLMSVNPFNSDNWGSERKDLEKRWLTMYRSYADPNLKHQPLSCSS